MKLIITNNRCSPVVLGCFALATHHASAFAGTSFRHPFASATYTPSTSQLKMSKKVLVPIADGSEEIETTCITDTLTRFGAEVTTASVMSSLTCTMSRGIKIVADCSIDDAVTKEWDLVVLPGGMPGAEHLRDCEPLIKLLKEQKRSSKLYGAICASPAVALASHGLLVDGPATCYPAPGFREKIAQVSNEPVVVTNNMVTSQGPGTSLLFALQLGEQLYGKDKRDEIAKQMLVH